MPILSTYDLTVRIAECRVCQDLEFSIHAGEVWGLLGNNGVGKTTLLHTLAGLCPPADGDITIHGLSYGQIKRRILAQQVGILLQEHDDFFPDTVIDTTLSGRFPYLKPWQWESVNDHKLAVAALGKVDLAGMEQRQVATLSGGERRRLAIASLITQDPDLFLLDEPTNHLDLSHQINILDELCRYVRSHGKAVLMVLHDANMAMRFCDHFLFLFGQGRLEQGTRAQLMRPAKLEQLFGYPISAVAAPQGPVFIPR